MSARACVSLSWGRWVGRHCFVCSSVQLAYAVRCSPFGPNLGQRLLQDQWFLRNYGSSGRFVYAFIRVSIESIIVSLTNHPFALRLFLLCCLCGISRALKCNAKGLEKPPLVNVLSTCSRRSAAISQRLVAAAPRLVNVCAV